MQANASEGPMTAILIAPGRSLAPRASRRRSLPSMNRALEAAVKTVDGRQASHALESLLDESLSLPGERIPLSPLRGTTA